MRIGRRGLVMQRALSPVLNCFLQGTSYLFHLNPPAKLFVSITHCNAVTCICCLLIVRWAPNILLAPTSVMHVDLEVFVLHQIFKFHPLFLFSSWIYFNQFWTYMFYLLWVRFALISKPFQILMSSWYAIPSVAHCISFKFTPMKTFIGFSPHKFTVRRGLSFALLNTFFICNWVLFPLNET